MAKVAILNDLHFGVRNDATIFLDAQEKFFKEIFFPKIEELHIDTVLNLGDTFDRRKYINYGTLVRSQQFFFEPMARKKIWSPTLIGNHDTFYKNTNKVNSIALLLEQHKQYSNIQIIDEPKLLRIDNLDVAMVPWICEENIYESMEFINNAVTDVCMGHFNINGFIMQIGQVAEDGLDRQIFDRYDMVFSGHFHHRSSDGRIVYLGSQYQMTWADYSDIKGFHIFDTETRDLEFIPNPHKMFRVLTYNDVSDSHLCDLSIYTGAYVKLVIERKNDSKKYEKFLETLYKVNPFDLRIVESYADISDIPDDVPVIDGGDELSLLHTYIEHAKLSQDINKDRLKTLFNQIYMESQNIES